MPDTLLAAPEQRTRTDPARFEVVKNALYSAAEEMKIVLAKTAYSPLLKVAGDYSCGIFDATGEMVAQGPDLPIHLGSMPDAVRAVVKAFAADVHPGDVFIPNAPLFRGGHPAPRRQRGAAGVPRRPPARLRVPAGALARRRLGDAGQLRRGDADLRRGPAHAAAAPPQPRRRPWRPRAADPRKCAHAGRAQGRPRRPARRDPAGDRAAGGAGRTLRRRRADRLH